MTNDDLTLARKKFNLAQRFLIDIDSYIELADNANEDLIKFIEMINGKSLIKEHIAFDINQDRAMIESNIKNFLPDLFNQDFIDDVVDSLIKSYPSLLSLKKYDGEKTEVYDNFMQVSYSVYNLDMQDFSDKIFLARIIEIDGYKFIISFVSQFEELQKDFFLQSLRQLFFYKGFFEFRINKKTQEMKDFLKAYFLDILIAYTVDLTSKIKSKDDQIAGEKEKIILNNIFSDKADRQLFKDYRNSVSKKYEIDKTKIVFIFDDIIGSLVQDQIDLSNPENYNLEKIIKNNCKSGRFFIDAHLKEVLNILTDFFSYAKDKDEKFLKPYNEIQEVSKNIFTYMNYLKNSISGLYFDQHLISILKDLKTCPFLDKSYLFINSINESKLSLSKNGDMITDAGIKKLANLLKLSPIKDVKRPNQSHYPLLEFLFNFFYKKGFIESKDKELCLSDDINKFLYLKNNEKIAVFIYSFLNENFMLTFLRKQRYQAFLDSIIKMLKSIKINEISLDSLSKNKLDMFSLNLLKSLNMVDINDKLIFITPLGENIYNYYLNTIKKNNIINFQNYVR